MYYKNLYRIKQISSDAVHYVSSGTNLFTGFIIIWQQLLWNINFVDTFFMQHSSIQLISWKLLQALKLPTDVLFGTQKSNFIQPLHSYVAVQGCSYSAEGAAVIGWLIRTSLKDKREGIVICWEKCLFVFSVFFPTLVWHQKERLECLLFKEYYKSNQNCVCFYYLFISGCTRHCGTWPVLINGSIGSWKRSDWDVDKTFPHCFKLFLNVQCWLFTLY